ncbi:MAG: anti-anti-sigma factor [Rhodospirillaceae bacterium]|jgi:anti-sigma B factor antagonist|nr:anti-anti-sigma factor [Rhodospirillaceae bacterium]|tara:strand:+ start:925 stop:1257 length:333 start_codon:yes stop_codon:yes gene_type:complete
MELSIAEEGEIVVVTLKGDIDLKDSSRMRQNLLDVPGDARAVIVDLSGVAMIDSSGIASLLEGFQEARKKGKDFVLAAPGDPVMRVLKLARLDTVFRIADDVTAAKEAVS